MNEYSHLFSKAITCDEARYIYFCEEKKLDEVEEKKLRAAYLEVSNRLFEKRLREMEKIYGI